MMFHAVAIANRYHRLASFDAPSLAHAARELPKHRLNTHAVILRDGSTGKRYSPHECAQLAGAVA